MEAEERKKKQGRPGNTYYVNDVWWTRGGRRGEVPDYKLVCNKPYSEFLTGGVEYCRSHECLGSWLSLERSMMKSSMLFERGRRKKRGRPGNEATCNTQFYNRDNRISKQ